MTPQQLLREAAEAIERAIEILDMSRLSPRDGEQRGRFRNFAHAKAYSKIASLPRRLRREAQFLDDKDAKTRGDSAALE